MSRYIDADVLSKYFDALEKHAEMEGLYNHAHLYNRCLRLVEETPTADVVEVVRCKDCVHFDRRSGTCNYFGYYTYSPDVDEDDFCSHGERSKNGT